jgi:hypothetical protein
MVLTKQQTASIESAMADFLSKRRPPEEIRNKVDLAWRIEGQSVLIYHIRPFWRDDSQKIEDSVAKASYNSKTNRWKIYWRRADQKWHAYPPYPEAVFFDEFLTVVDEDENCCFWG